jgi:hypothetical protein
MSEQEINRPSEDEDVEAHRAGANKKVLANDEAPKDDETEDDVELHRGTGANKVK